MTVDICRWHLAIPTNKLKPSAIFVQGKQAQPLKGNGYLLRMDMLWLVVLHQHQVHTCRGSWYQKNTFLFGGHVWPILKGAKICWLILTDFRRSNIPFPIRFPLHPWKWTVFEFIEPQNHPFCKGKSSIYYSKPPWLYSRNATFPGCSGSNPSKCFHQFFSGIRRVTAAMLCITSLLTLVSLGVSPWNFHNIR